MICPQDLCVLRCVTGARNGDSDLKGKSSWNEGDTLVSGNENAGLRFQEH